MLAEQLTPSIQRENKICELAIQKLEARCLKFETRFGMASDEFLSLFMEGKLDDDESFFEWKALVEGIHEWRKTRDELARLIR